MAWTPKAQVIDTRQIVDNLLAFISANQVAALAWANNNATPVLPPFARLYNSAEGRITTVFPCLMVLRQDLTEKSDDFIEALLALSLEGWIQGGNTATLVSNAKKYERAVRSMCVNATGLMAGSDIATAYDVDSLDSQLDVLRGNDSIYMQRFQIRITYALHTGYFHN